MKTTVIIGRISSIGKLIRRATGNDVAEIIVYNTIHTRWKTEHKQCFRGFRCVNYVQIYKCDGEFKSLLKHFDRNSTLG